VADQQTRKALKQKYGLNAAILQMYPIKIENAFQCKSKFKGFGKASRKIAAQYFSILKAEKRALLPKVTGKKRKASAIEKDDVDTKTTAVAAPVAEVAVDEPVKTTAAVTVADVEAVAQVEPEKEKKEKKKKEKKSKKKKKKKKSNKAEDE
jgi:hypothetical protein